MKTDKSSEQNTYNAKVESIDNVNNQYIVEERKFFTNSKKEDTFILKLTGNDPLSSIIHFRIIDYAGNEVYFDDFPSKALIGYGLIEKEKVTPKDQRDYILSRMKSFFDSSNFIRNPINKNEEYDPDYYYVNKNDWSEIKTSNNLAFNYLLWESDMKWIIYYKGEVILLKRCC